ncbi:hypothetical protein Leryth_008728 [Lithospermum erythrorhizon]|nr:hypothetical protein Leryth_008728 [Lithospermum erythrorhizon]
MRLRVHGIKEKSENGKDQITRTSRVHASDSIGPWRAWLCSREAKSLLFYNSSIWKKILSIDSYAISVNNVKGICSILSSLIKLAYMASSLN